MNDSDVDAIVFALFALVLRCVGFAVFALRCVAFGLRVTSSLCLKSISIFISHILLYNSRFHVITAWFFSDINDVFIIDYSNKVK